MKKLFLSSAGIVLETEEHFLELFGRDPKGLKVAFIPTAANLEKDKSFVQWSIDQIQDLGMEVVQVDLAEENQNSLSEKLSDCDIIWVNGGNTFYLLEQVRESGFDKIIGDLLNRGKIYVGVSAGSYIACPNIEAAGWKDGGDSNIVGLKDLSALNLVPFLLTAHYVEQYYSTIEEEAQKIDYPIVALTDKQAVVVEGEKIKIVGEGEKINFNNFIEN